MANEGFLSRLKAVFTASEIDDDFYEELEEVLITSDLGVTATESIIEEMQSEIKKRHLKKLDECKELLIELLKGKMALCEADYEFEKGPCVILMTGVNGVGKTTSAGKLAYKFKSEGKKVILAAADTFRAAATEQLVEWAGRAGVDIIKGNDGQDPASVVFDAVACAKARRADVLIIDTAGRLHNKKNLMEELKKIRRIIEKEFPDAMQEVLLVLDATTGQNALSQAREFMEATSLTGVLLTKLDGSAKGGIAIAIHSEFGIPVKYVGIGEQMADIKCFDADEYINSIYEGFTD